LAEPKPSKTSSSPSNVITQSSEPNDDDDDDDDAFGRRLAEVKRRVRDLAEVRGGTVRIASCRDGKLVGRRGVVARVTARAAHVVALAPSAPETQTQSPQSPQSRRTRRGDVFVAPRKGTTFRLELESVPGMHDREGGGSWVDIKGENLAGG
jgi:RNase P/RNase MRP subunit p29